jgi:hypothetical protein
MRLEPLLRVGIRSAIAGIISLFALHAFANTPLPRALFSEQSLPLKDALPKHAIRGKSRAVKIDHKQLRRGRFSVNLPGGVTYEAVRELHQDMGKGRYSWVGHARDDESNSVVIGISGEAVAATFAYHGKLFKLEPRANGSHVVSEVLNTNPATELDPVAVADTSAPSPATAITSMPANTGYPVIDVLVAYTPAVRALYGTQGTEALIIQAVAEANQAYSHSKMTTRLNLVRTVLTPYTESGDIYSDLARLRSVSDGHMDELHALRNNHGADVVSLIANEPLYCGLAYRMATLSASFQSSAFSVVHHGCATGYYSFVHEIGHNQGAHHDAANASGAIYPYAYGYRDPYNRFRTIMAYDCPGGCPRAPGFSNGDNPVWGIPTGDPLYASNARAIDETAPTVAAFRQSMAPSPGAPTGLNNTASGTTNLSLAWTDNADNESGFLLERSTDGLSFLQVASLPENSVTYIDDNLQSNTLYYYRVKAWNSSASSGYSNVAVATTAQAPTYIDQLIDSELSAGGIVSGSFVNTHALHDASESITEIVSWTAAPNRFSYLEHYWSIQVQPGASHTLQALVSTTAPTQSFTFAYSTTPVILSVDNTVWTDMFIVSAQNPGAKQFTLPPSLSGTVFISVRDNERVPQLFTSDTIDIDLLMIRTELNAGPAPAPLIYPDSDPGL